MGLSTSFRADDYTNLKMSALKRLAREGDVWALAEITERYAEGVRGAKQNETLADKYARKLVKDDLSDDEPDDIEAFVIEADEELDEDAPVNAFDEEEAADHPASLRAEADMHIEDGNIKGLQTILIIIDFTLSNHDDEAEMSTADADTLLAIKDDIESYIRGQRHGTEYDEPAFV